VREVAAEAEEAWRRSSTAIGGTGLTENIGNDAQAIGVGIL
jgi:hypothetical protein